MDEAVADLLATLWGRGIVSGATCDSVAQAERDHPTGAGPAEIVARLKKRGDLTEYQAKRIVAGEVGGLVIGPYVLREPKGEGGMGTVFRARDTAMGRDVALKLIRDGRTNPGEAVRRFRAEIQAAGQLGHPNVVVAHAAGEVEGVPYFVMEYVEGTDLGTLVRERGPMGIVEACDATRQAAKGLDHIHVRNHVHRDIKPANLLRADADRTVKVADLGLARLGDGETDGITLDDRIVGSPDYLAPEAAEHSRNSDIRSDIYSLGCTLYHLLAGKPPYPGGTAVEKLIRHRDAAPVPLDITRPDLPAGLSAVVRKMMARWPDDRYQTPREVATALAPFADPDGDSRWGTPTPDALLSALAESSRMPGFVPWVVAMIALAAVGLGMWVMRRGEVSFDQPVRDRFVPILTEPRSKPTAAEVERDRRIRELTERGAILVKSQKYDEAISFLDEAIGLGPNDGEAYNGRGTCHRMRKEFDAAIADYSEAIRRAVDPGKYLANRGEANRLAGHLDRAEADLDAAISYRPRIAYYYRLRGTIRLHRGNLDGARDDLDEAVRFDPKDRAAYIARAQVHDGRGDQEAARADRAEVARLANGS